MADAPAPRRRLRRKQSDEEEDFFSSFSSDTKSFDINESLSRNEEKRAEETPVGPYPGKTVASLSEEEKKKLQQQLIDGMFKYAEQKYGRKKPQKDVVKGTAKEDYELYLRSLKTKVKQAADRLQGFLRQKKEIEKKVEGAQQESDLVTGKLTKAEEEKQNALDESRDPVLPKDFIVPQRSKRLGASLGALVMKASTQDWGAALQEFASSRKGKTAGKAPEWNVKRDKTAAILKAGSSGTASQKKEEDPANAFKVSLKKTGYIKEETAT